MALPGGEVGEIGGRTSPSRRWSSGRIGRTPGGPPPGDNERSTSPGSSRRWTRALPPPATSASRQPPPDRRAARSDICIVMADPVPVAGPATVGTDTVTPPAAATGPIAYRTRWAAAGRGGRRFSGRGDPAGDEGRAVPDHPEAAGQPDAPLVALGIARRAAGGAARLPVGPYHERGGHDELVQASAAPLRVQAHGPGVGVLGRALRRPWRPGPRPTWRSRGPHTRPRQRSPALADGTQPGGPPHAERRAKPPPPRHNANAQEPDGGRWPA